MAEPASPNPNPRPHSPDARPDARPDAFPAAFPAAPASDDRYSRQVLFPGIGAEGQRQLARSHVALVGVGATGAASASLLARAGAGEVTLIDRDFVEPSNLQRQVLFDEADAAAAMPKAEAARRKIALFNSGVQVNARIADLVPGNIHALLADADLVLDCTDNFETRFLLNDYAIEQGKPWIYAAAIGASIATMNILPGAIGQTDRTACLACLFPTAPTGTVETCDTAGILGAAVNLAASIQTAEAMKLLTGQPALMRRTLLAWDLWSSTHSEISTDEPDPACAVCAQRRFHWLAGVGRPHITLCGRNAVQIHEHHRPVQLLELQERLARQPDIEQLQASSLLLRFRRGAHRITIFPDGRALVQGTTDPVVARSLYARFIGS